ncbi:MAG: HAD family hydrolase [Lachnospiraceae bacterium]|nr:HAD family hydrolase [Lachnospiraceae bacterium]
MDKKTLYVSDLDGTLMRSDETISNFTIETINRLIGQGLAFTYATARSIGSARPIAGGLKLELPVITRNGAALADNTDGHVIEKSVFTTEEVEFLKTRLPEVAEFGFVSCFLGDRMVRTWLPGKHSPGLQGYIDYYEKDPTLVRADGPETLYCGEPGYVTLIGEREEIAPLYERMREYTGWECLFQKDTYRDEYWLEICPQNCTKAKAIRKMKEKYGFEKLVVFGDALNDVPMFRIADEAYAVENARPEAKGAATGILGKNDEDAVAKFLAEIMDPAPRLIMEDTAVWFVYHGEKYFISCHPYEPCLYLKQGDKYALTLHNAFTQEEIIKVFRAGQRLRAIDGTTYDETEFCKALAGALDHGRVNVDFTYAAKKERGLK